MNEETRLKLTQIVLESLDTFTFSFKACIDFNLICKKYRDKLKEGLRDYLRKTYFNDILTGSAFMGFEDIK